MVRLETRNFTKTRVEIAKLKLLAGRALRYSRHSVGRDVLLSLVLVGDTRMRRFNRRYRGEDQTTDVISFSFLEDRARIPQHFLGEIFISIPRAKKQARELGHGFQKEIEHLFVHGLLHILGYDHERSRKEARRMEKSEEKILNP